MTDDVFFYETDYLFRKIYEYEEDFPNFQNDWIDTFREQWDEKNYLTIRQKQVLLRICRKHGILEKRPKIDPKEPLPWESK